MRQEKLLQRKNMKHKWTILKEWLERFQAIDVYYCLLITIDNKTCA